LIKREGRDAIVDLEAIEQEYMLNLTHTLRSAIAVASITIDLSESQLQQLQDLAAAHGIAIEVLLKISLEDWLNAQKDEFLDAADYVLTKNTELYQRLA
jgi:antitoxin FitA